jgi:hypothetical protein
MGQKIRARWTRESLARGARILKHIFECTAGGRFVADEIAWVAIQSQGTGFKQNRVAD